MGQGEHPALIWWCASFLLVKLVTRDEAQDRVLAVASEAKDAADAELNVVLQFSSQVDAQVSFIGMFASDAVDGSSAGIQVPHCGCC